MNFKKISLIILIACFTLNNSCTHTSNALDNKNKHDYNAVKEYINRVGKLLLITNYDRYVVNNLEISFDVNNNKTPFLNVEQPRIFSNIWNQKTNNKKYTITISKELLNYLYDEATLATILAVGIETIHSNNFFSIEIREALQADTRIINNLYRSGYDPEAFIDLQKEYLILKRQNFKNNWLNFLFSNAIINNIRIANNKKKLLLLPKGLARAKQNYLQNIKSFRIFDR